LIANNVEFWRYCGGHFENGDGRNFSISEINSGYHNLPTYEMSLKSDNVELVRYCGHNTAKIQHCSLSKVAFDLFVEPVVSGRFGTLETS
jgi:hypothetical protein